MPRKVGSEMRTQAGIEVSGKTLRYAEVETGSADGEREMVAPGPRLLRLGSCDFEFDVEAALLDPTSPTHLNTVAEAVGSIFRGSEAERLSVAVHPWNATTFFTPLLAGAAPGDRLEQLRQEAAMLSDERASRSLSVTATTARAETRRDGREYLWHHVMRLPDAAQARIGHLAGTIRSGIAIAFTDSTAAAAETMTRRLAGFQENEADAEPGAVALGVGTYGDRMELTLTSGSTWHHGQWVPCEQAADALYFVALLLERIGLGHERIKRLFVYGEGQGEAPLSDLESFFGTEAVPLSPIPLFALARSSADPRSLAAFAPCVGAALKL